MKPADRPRPDGWLELAKHARETGIPERTLRRRLTALHERKGGGVLRAYNPPGTSVRKYWFNPAALQAALEQDPDETEVSLGSHRVLIEELTEKVNALRQAHNSLKRQVKALKRSDHT